MMWHEPLFERVALVTAGTEGETHQVAGVGISGSKRRESVFEEVGTSVASQGPGISTTPDLCFQKKGKRVVDELIAGIALTVVTLMRRRDEILTIVGFTHVTGKIISTKGFAAPLASRIRSGTAEEGFEFVASVSGMLERLDGTLDEAHVNGFGEVVGVAEEFALVLNESGVIEAGVLMSRLRPEERFGRLLAEGLSIAGGKVVEEVSE